MCRPAHWTRSANMRARLSAARATSRGGQVRVPSNHSVQASAVTSAAAGQLLQACTLGDSNVSDQNVPRCAFMPGKNATGLQHTQSCKAADRPVRVPVPCLGYIRKLGIASTQIPCKGSTPLVVHTWRMAADVCRHHPETMPGGCCILRRQLQARGRTALSMQLWM